MAEENQAVGTVGATEDVAAGAKTVSLWDCPKCRTHNTIASKFCRECGAKLVSPEEFEQEEVPQEDRERRQERVAALIASAFQKSEAGNPYEALPLAEEAVSLVPGSTSALALLASLYERTGQPEKAMEAMERVVVLNPDSVADRRRLERLQQGELRSHPTILSSADERKPTEVKQWMPLVFAGAAMALVFGVLVSTLNNRPNTSRPLPTAPTTTFRPTYYPMATNGMTTQPRSLYIGQQQPYGNPPAPVVTPYVQNTPNPASPAPANRTPVRPEAGPASGTLPLPGQISPGAIRPVPPADPASDPANPATTGNVPPVVLTPPPGNGGFGSGERVRVGPPQNPPAGPAPASEPGPVTEGQTPNGGYIRIRVGPGGTQTQTPIPPPAAPQGDDPNGQPEGNTGKGDNDQALSESPNARAFRLQSLGRYMEAIAAYRDAIARDLATGDTYLGIARCYEKIGESMQAKGAYGKAIQAYEAQISAGRSTPAVRQGIVTCRAALDVLGG